MSFSDQLKAARAKGNVTQAEADEICGLGKGTIASWESDRYVPHQYMIDGALASLVRRAAGVPERARDTTKRPVLGRNPYISGIRGRDAGLPLDACPVTTRSRHWRLWRAGWLDRDACLTRGRNTPVRDEAKPRSL